MMKEEHINKPTELNFMREEVEEPQFGYGNKGQDGITAKSKNTRKHHKLEEEMITALPYLVFFFLSNVT